VTQIGQRFCLSNRRGNGVYCSDDGLFIGVVPLLEPTEAGHWRPRPISDLNRDLGKCYGLPVTFDAKLTGLAAITRALCLGDIVHAKIATLHLQIPDPPSLAKSKRTTEETIDLAYRLRASGLLKADWDPTKHPRCIGGEFAPIDDVSNDPASDETNARVIPVQGATITAPFDFALPRTFPFPSEIAPVPPIVPNINPRDVPRNPSSDSPECAEEWAEAATYCGDLMRRGLLGRGDYRGSGRTLQQCIMGRVSQRCGGNGVGA
jgi:hypothetical protein